MIAGVVDGKPNFVILLMDDVSSTAYVFFFFCWKDNSHRHPEWSIQSGTNIYVLVQDTIRYTIKKICSTKIINLYQSALIAAY